MRQSKSIAALIKQLEAQQKIIGETASSVAKSKISAKLPKKLTTTISSVKSNLLQSSHHRSYSTMVHRDDKNKRWYIHPLAPSTLTSRRKICTLDIETINYKDGIQSAMAISFYKERSVFKSIVQLIDLDLYYVNRKLAIAEMWNNFYAQLKALNLGRDLIIYTHNLGSFDYYLLPSIYSLAEKKNRTFDLLSWKVSFNQLNYFSFGFLLIY